MQTTDIISKFFIREYYTKLHQDYKSMYVFYAPDCFMSIAMNKQPALKCNGKDKVISLLEEFNLREAVSNLDNGHMSVAPLEHGGMLILVSGQMLLSDNKERFFSQCFVLGKKSESGNEFYEIRSDMLHLVDLAEMGEYVEVEEEVEDASEPLPESIPESPSASPSESIPKPLPASAASPSAPEPASEAVPSVEPLSVPASDLHSEPVEESVEEPAEEPAEEPVAEPSASEPFIPSIPEAPASEAPSQTENETPAEEETPAEAEIPAEAKEEEPVEKKKEEEEPTQEPQPSAADAAKPADSAIPEPKEAKPEVKEKPKEKPEAKEKPKTEPKKKPSTPQGNQGNQGNQGTHRSHGRYGPNGHRYGESSNADKNAPNDDEFVTVRSHFPSNKRSQAGSSLFVRYHDPMINRDALKQTFKSEGTVVNVHVMEGRMFAFVDFEEEGAAKKAMERKQTKPFYVGGDMLEVDLKRERGKEYARKHRNWRE